MTISYQLETRANLGSPSHSGRSHGGAGEEVAAQARTVCQNQEIAAVWL